MPHAWLPPTPVYRLVCALAGQALTCPFWVSWRNKGLRRSRPRLWGAQTVQLLTVYTRCFILHKVIHAKPPPQVQKDRYSRIKAVQWISGQKENKLQIFWLSHPHEENSCCFSFTYVLSSLSFTGDSDGNHSEYWRYNKGPAVVHCRCVDADLQKQRQRVPFRWPSNLWKPADDPDVVFEHSLFGQPLNIIWNRKTKWKKKKNQTANIWYMGIHNYSEVSGDPESLFPWRVWFLCELAGYIIFFFCFILPSWQA